MKRLLPLFFILSFFSAAFSQAPELVLGNPSKATTNTTSSDNYLVVHNGYILSYNKSRGAANWVTWHLSATDMGPIDRTDAFAADTSLPADWQIKADDYDRSGYDRGHMCPSEDRTNTVEANRETFLMSNMEPQTPRLNRGTWKSFESEVQKLVKQQGFEAYNTAGCYGDKGRVNGNVMVPDRCWKIVVLLPEGKNDLRRINCSTRVIAIDMPNVTLMVAGWRNHRTTVKALETATGYDFFSKLSKKKQACLAQKVDDQ